jgi:hypothetical protein
MALKALATSCHITKHDTAVPDRHDTQPQRVESDAVSRRPDAHHANNHTRIPGHVFHSQRLGLDARRDDAGVLARQARA